MLPMFIRNHREVRDEWHKSGKYALGIGAVSPLAYILVLYAMQTAPSAMSHRCARYQCCSPLGSVRGCSKRSN